MRPHRLELTAIGSYAGDVVLDFDALAPFGLFHINGPTGAGKSSLLDGLCFALYGRVPPPRAADQLRSHHAGPKVEAKATLDFSLQGVDYRVVRTPTQWRTKKVGTGRTEQRATAALHRRNDESFEPVVSGVREVDAFIEELIGLDHEQFMQVVVLPQGGFQEALRASAKDRGELLSTLFHAERFGQYGERLKQRAAFATKELEERTSQASHVLHQIRQRTTAAGLGTPWPEVVHLDNVELACLEQGVEEAKHLAAQHGVELATAARNREAAGVALSNGARVHDRHLRRQRALAQLDELFKREGELSQAEAMLKAAADVQPLLPSIETYRSLQREITVITGRIDSQDEMIALALDQLSIAAPALAATDAPQCLEVVSGISGTIEELRRLEVDIARRKDVAVRHADALAATEARVTVLTSDMEEAEAVIKNLESTASDVERLTTEVARLHDEQMAADRVRHTRNRTAAIEVELKAAQDESSRLSEQHLALWERRLKGMAAELAGQLKNGTPCSVCGSKQHPAPAEAAKDQVSEEDVERARAAAEIAQGVVDSIRLRLDEAALVLQRELVLARDAAQDPKRHAEILGNTSEALEASRHASSRLANAVTRMEKSQVAHRQMLDELTDLRRLAADNEALLNQDIERALHCKAVLDTVLGPRADTEASTAIAQELRDALDEKRRLSIEVQATRTHHQDVESRLTKALTEVECDSISAAIERTLDPSMFDRLTTLLAEAGQLRASASALLEETSDLAEAEPIDLDGLKKKADEAHLAYDRIVESKASADLLANECTTALRTITRTFNEVAPLRVEADGVRHLAEMCFSGKNEKRMSLKNFVLAAYLEEVAAAASTRLKVMSSGRYELHHSDKLVKGGAGSGLSLVVSDAYTGQEREVNSLSGGETFMASLALALGLADVVQSHAGGVHIEALFIDEGFGSLDADTLELAMAELDRLREGGRLVGVISHVPTLKERIPAGIEVVAGSNGSTIRMRNGTTEAA